jgi:hypothetical protein
MANGADWVLFHGSEQPGKPGTVGGTVDDEIFNNKRVNL